MQWFNAEINFINKNQTFCPHFSIGNIIDILSFVTNYSMMSQNNDKFTEQDGLNINSDENMSGTGHLTDPIEENRLDDLTAELNESKDKYLRLAAEFDNFRKRTAKERLELFQTAGKDIVTDLLDVVDDIDRAAGEGGESENKNISQGISLIFGKLKNILQSRGLKPMEAKGRDFDPELHEAIAEVPAPTPDLVGKVIDEITKGYYLNDKLIRHAKVVVGK